MKFVHALLGYQASEYDCGPTAAVNALKLLYKTNEIPPDFLKIVWNTCLDEYNPEGAAYRRGTSQKSMQFLAWQLNHYGETTGYPIKASYLEKEDVTSTNMIPCLQRGGAVVVRCIFAVPHYITLTGVEGNEYKAFDPYYCDDWHLEGVKWISGHEDSYNRLIDIKHFDLKEDVNYAMGSIDTRACILFEKTGEGKVFLQ
ncbi:MAG: hypothetical protein VZT48_06750 [Bulleidia sp.]|nr:hypothetical protein [Bulleidia sp.]